MTVDKLITLACSQNTPPSGLTISGGEPTDQAVGISELVRQFRGAFPGTEVLLYSGLPWEDLARLHPELLALVDVVVAGPYESLIPATPLAGSANQTVKLLTPLAEQVYGNWKAWPLHVQQVSATGDSQVVTVGIPDTRRMHQAAVEVSAVSVSWQRQPQDRGRVHGRTTSSTAIDSNKHKADIRDDL